MLTFSTRDLGKRVDDVIDAAIEAPVLITRRRKPCFVMMSVEHYGRLRRLADPRRVFGPGETPVDLAAAFRAKLDSLASGVDYDVES